MTVGEQLTETDVIENCNFMNGDAALSVPQPVHNICPHVSDENLQHWQLLPETRPLLDFKVSQLNGDLFDRQFYGNVGEYLS